MKVRVKKGRFSRGRTLVVDGRRGERLVGVRVRKLMEASEPTLLSLALEPEVRKGRVRLTYDASGRTCVRERARAPDFSSAMLRSFCVDLLRATQWCARNHVPNTALLCGAEHACVSENTRLELAFVPLDIMGIPSDESPLSLIAFLDHRATRCLTSPEDEAIVKELHAFVVRSNTIFSANRFASFVHGICGMTECEVGGDQALGTWSLVDQSTGRSYAFALGGGAITVGRDSSCEVCLADSARISRRHVRVSCDGHKVRICDVGSTNGTSVHGRRLAVHEEVLLDIGECFELAGNAFLVERP